LNAIFDDKFYEKIQATGASRNRDELDAQNGATEFMFWDLVAQAYNDKDNLRVDEILFESENCLESIQDSLLIIAPQNSKQC
jgi:hypothetical protein